MIIFTFEIKAHDKVWFILETVFIRAVNFVGSKHLDEIDSPHGSIDIPWSPNCQLEHMDAIESNEDVSLRYYFKLSWF